MAPPKVVCVLKRSTEYDTDYVDRLQGGLKRNLTVINEPPWPGWWSKMALFSPELKGDLLYFDLDTVIVGSIEELFTGKLTMLSDFNLLHYVASGVMYLPEADRKPVWDEWIKDPEGHMRKHRGHGDGGFLSKFYKTTALRWQDILPGKIVSYKKHCKEGVPKSASVVAFHGRPRPRDVDWKV